jgi:hypothetical protein
MEKKAIEWRQDLESRLRKEMADHIAAQVATGKEGELESIPDYY